MGQIAEFLIKILGSVMLFCYGALKNYGLSIILFTLITKVILFPISLFTQKNAIKMVKMQPELDALKIKYIDDKDKFTDEQIALYKRFKYNPFMDTVPLIIQVILVLGLIQVIYRPLSYAIGLDAGMVASMKQWLINTGKAAENGHTYQIEIIKQIKDGMVPSGIPFDVINTVKNFDINFCGINLSLTPSLKEWNRLLVMPLLAGLSAFIMCMAQNKINVLQMAQSSAGKTAQTVFMIAFSTYFAFILPAGVGLYWVFGNLFAIPSMMLVNAVIPPKKYIDYDYLIKTRETKLLKEKEHKKYIKREKADYKRFFAVKDMQLMIYSEQNGFYKYYQGMIDYICDHSDIVIHYVTSDPNDNIFKDTREQIKAYYVASDRYLVPLFMKLDCKMCIMTTPDLEKYHIKRSRVNKDVEYVFMGHSMGSYALTLRKGALDWFDTVFCPGIDTLEEIKETEKVYGLPPKKLVEAGYPVIDSMAKEYAESKHEKNDPPKVLIAPSWQPDNIIDTCLDAILDELAKSRYDVTVRPHPQHVRHEPEKFEMFKEKYKDNKNIFIQTDFSSNTSVLEADILITDWSNISWEFAFVTKKPVLFIDTPMKVMNPEYEKIGIVPVNITIRDVIGKALAPDELGRINETVDEFVLNKEEYAQKIEQAYKKHLYNIGRSAELCGRYVIKFLK